MTTESRPTPSLGYTLNVRLDDSRSYDCDLCPNSAPDLDAARAHKAVHVAGPELFEAAQAAIRYDEAISSCANDPAKMATFCTAQGEDLDGLYEGWMLKSRAAAAKAEPKG